VLHLRKDYDAIQPWPVHRPHIAKVAGELRAGITDGAALVEGIIEPIIPDDEPVFLLRATDPVAAHTVRFWAMEALAAGADLTLCERVRAWADEMDAYRAQQEDVKSFPDTPAGMLRR
jgi:hypothetical protein